MASHLGKRRHAADALAADSDVVVVVVGTNEEVESEGFDRTSLALPVRQDELVSAVAAANPRTVVVVNAGAPVLLPWSDEVAAVLVSWFPGQEFGNALADVLTGTVEPGGRGHEGVPQGRSDLRALAEQMKRPLELRYGAPSCQTTLAMQDRDCQGVMGGAGGCAR